MRSCFSCLNFIGLFSHIKKTLEKLLPDFNAYLSKCQVNLNDMNGKSANQLELYESICVKQDPVDRLIENPSVFTDSCKPETKGDQMVNKKPDRTRRKRALSLNPKDDSFDKKKTTKDLRKRTRLSAELQDINDNPILNKDEIKETPKLNIRSIRSKSLGAARRVTFSAELEQHVPSQSCSEEITKTESSQATDNMISLDSNQASNIPRTLDAAKLGQLIEKYKIKECQIVLKRLDNLKQNIDPPNPTASKNKSQTRKPKSNKKKMKVPVETKCDIITEVEVKIELLTEPETTPKAKKIEKLIEIAVPDKSGDKEKYPREKNEIFKMPVKTPFKRSRVNSLDDSMIRQRKKSKSFKTPRRKKEIKSLSQNTRTNLESDKNNLVKNDSLEIPTGTLPEVLVITEDYVDYMATNGNWLLNENYYGS